MPVKTSNPRQLASARNREVVCPQNPACGGDAQQLYVRSTTAIEHRLGNAITERVVYSLWEVAPSES